MSYEEHELSAGEIAQAKETGAFLLDVREDWEWEICHIPGSSWIPMNSIPDRLDEIPKGKPIITICHHGVRSLNVAFFLMENGFPEVKSLRGGVDAYSWEVDSQMPRY